MSSVPPLSNFPDLCLLNIFTNVPLEDVIRNLGLVCRNWYRLRVTELSRRTSLVLIQHDSQLETLQAQENPFGSKLIELVRQDDGSPWAPPLRKLDQIRFDAVRVPGEGILTEGYATRLVELLPNITQLSVMQMDVPTVYLVVSALRQLIRHFNLVSFKLNFQVSDRDPIDHRFDNQVLSLVGSIYQLAPLRQLVLNVNVHGIYGLPANPEAPVSVCDIACDTPLTLQHLNSIKPEFASKYARVHLGSPTQANPQINTETVAAFQIPRHLQTISAQNYAQMREFCGRFSSLTSLSLDSCAMPLTILASCLAQLNSLAHLELEFDSIPPEEEAPPLPLDQVPSVRLITLKRSKTRLLTTMNLDCHADTERLFLAETIPNLQVLQLLDFFSLAHCCTICNINGNVMLPFTLHAAFLARIEHCKRLAQVPFQRCPKLHTIKVEVSPAEEI